MERLGYLWRWSKKYALIIIFIIILNFVLQWLYSYISLFVQVAFDVLGKESGNINLPNFLLDFFYSFKEPIKIIIVIAIAMILLQASRSFMRFLDGYIRGKTTENIGYDMRVTMYNHIGDLSYSYHNQSDIGDLIQRCTSDIDTSSSFISSQFPELINIFVTIGIGAYQVGKINMTLMLVSLASIPLLGISSIIWFNYVNKKFLEVEHAESKMTTIVQENVNGARVVRAFANEKYEFEKMDEANKEFARRDMALAKKEALYWGFSDFVVVFQYALTISISIYLAYKNEVNSADIVACLLLLGMLVWPIRGLGRIISNFGKTLVAVNRMEEILKEKSEYEDNGSLEPVINGNITFKNVYFHFDDTNNHLLNNISFKIKAGETIAIVGKTGSGKTTICNLLTRFLNNTAGDIYIDDTNIKDIEKHYLRRQIRMVLQDPFLFSKTVYENISIINDSYSNLEVKRAAKLAHIDAEIEKFEHGYETIVGEKGTTLSGGQKQRIAIARMLVDDSPIIIFDDSLSALDTKTDYLIREALKNKNKRTMIIITHRTTTAKEADRIMVLNNGTIEAFDTHENLIKKDGLYKELWEIQGNLEAEFKDILEKEER